MWFILSVKIIFARGVALNSGRVLHEIIQILEVLGVVASWGNNSELEFILRCLAESMKSIVIHVDVK